MDELKSKFPQRVVFSKIKPPKRFNRSISPKTRAALQFLSSQNRNSSHTRKQKHKNKRKMKRNIEKHFPRDFFKNIRKNEKHKYT